jgi:CBS domain containing-hemolysin-like protein
LTGRADPQPPPRPRLLARWRRGGEDREAGARETPDAGSNESAASEQERLIADALTDLRDIEVREVMTPRVNVTSLTIPVTADDVATAVRESGHSCFPVVHGDLDDIVGVLFVNDLFRTKRGALSDQRDGPSPLEISRRLRQPHVVPESLDVLEALAEMRRSHRGFAIVVDEYGGVAGVLTVKDLLEPLVGELPDEFDTGDEPQIVRVDSGRWLIDGSAAVDDVRERLLIDIPDGEYVTIGGFLFDAFGHIPEVGERMALGEWDLKVVEMDKRRIAKVVARRSPADTPQEAAPSAAATAPAAAGQPGNETGGHGDQVDGGGSGAAPTDFGAGASGKVRERVD